MKERRQGSPVLFEIVIDKLVYGGAGLGRHEGKVVFVPFAAPGDRLLVRVVQEKKNLIHASLERVLEPGPARREPFCVHFGTCGGCQWQHLDYAAQGEAKRSILEELFHHRFPETRSLHIDLRPAHETRGYRSRARLQVRGHGPESAVGFFGFQSHNVIDVQSCPLFVPALNTALVTIRDSWKQGTMDPGVQQVEFACSGQNADWAWAAIGPNFEEDSFSPGVNTAPNPAGASLVRRIGAYEYRLTPSAFFQVNDFMVGDLVATVLDLSRETRANTALDLFAGVGLFSLPLARHFSEVTSVELSAEACRLCRENAAAAGLRNIRVACADAAAWMKAASSVTSPGFDLVVLDPPRSGAGAEIMEFIRDWAIENVIYVSCDPQTLVRDLAALPERDYRIDFVQGIDLFPQTFHFETIVRLKRR